MVFADFTPEKIVDLVLGAFAGTESPTPEQVGQKVAEMLTGPFATLATHHDFIVDKIMERIQVRIGPASTLDGRDDNHTPWLGGQDKSGWKFWFRLKEYLLSMDHFPPSVLQELDRSTDQTLERLESPDRSGAWDRRGLVVGHVQSGKTTHYTALAAKALDAGYQIVIILAGTHNNLRSQTNERIDRHLIGRDSAALIEAAIGAGNPTTGLMGVGERDRLLGRPVLPVTILTCTNSADNGDFSTAVANRVGFNVSHGTRLVLVVKKHGGILNKLRNWLRKHNAAGHNRITAPVLIVDDEADNASINTADPDSNPTVINKRIRELLMTFDRVGFVGYTATPFANIFIDPNAGHQDLGPDLFPRSFIVNLKAPSDYVGPNIVFGHAGDESAGIPEQPPLPMFRKIDDTAPWLPDRHRGNATPNAMPESLREAVKAFVLVCAARSARGDMGVHNSMLVHATRFVNVQGRIAEQLEKELSGLQNLICSASMETVKRVYGELHELWQRLFLGPHEQFRDRLEDRCPELPDWNQVQACISDALARIQVMRINGSSTDALAYSRSPNGISVIAVGGEKLSRGLTLEGLSISYFLRTTRMFDTLLQMGRWFGYRKGYIDLCRVYTTGYLHRTFRDIALTFDDLRADLDRMAYANKTPLDFGLRIRTPADGQLITAANKIRNGEEVEVQFAGELLQSLEMWRRGERADQIRKSVKNFIAGNGPWERTLRGKKVAHFICHGKDNASAVIDFLGQFEAVATPSFNDRCEAIRRYITEQLRHGELKDWTVAVISKNDLRNQVEISPGFFIPKVERGTSGDDIWNKELLNLQGLTGSLDEAVDLSDEEFERADQLHKSALKSSDDPSRKSFREAMRETRPPQRGLLLLYLIQDRSDDPVDFIPAVAISFPKSPTAQSLTYTVNDVWKQQFGLVPEEVLDDEVA